MKLGKRRQEVSVPGVPGVKISTAGYQRFRRGKAAGGATAAASAPAEPAATDSWTPPAEPEPVAASAPAEPIPQDEPVVEGEAVELPPVEPAAPVYEPPVVATQPGSAPGPDSMPFASGHAAAPGPPWQEPMMELANERPEIVVGAAFAGGLLAAMILRRLGN
jgi:hypothetical protein